MKMSFPFAAFMPFKVVYFPQIPFPLCFLIKLKPVFQSSTQMLDPQSHLESSS